MPKSGILLSIQLHNGLAILRQSIPNIFRRASSLNFQLPEIFFCISSQSTYVTSSQAVIFSNPCYLSIDFTLDAWKKQNDDI